MRVLLFNILFLVSSVGFAQSELFTFNKYSRIEKAAAKENAAILDELPETEQQLYKAFVAENKGDFKSASQNFHSFYLNKGNQLSENTLSAVLFELSVVNYHLKAPKIAIDYLSKIENIDKITQLKIFEQMAICYSDMSEIDSSIHYFKEAIKFSSNFSDSIKNTHNLCGMAFNNSIDEQFIGELNWIIASKNRANSNRDSVIIANTYLIFLERALKKEDYSAIEKYTSNFKTFIQQGSGYRNQYHEYNLMVFEYLIAKKKGQNNLALDLAEKLQSFKLPNFTNNRLKYKLYLLFYKTAFHKISTLSNDQIIDSLDFYKNKIGENDIDNINTISGQYNSSLKENLRLTEDQLKTENDKTTALEKVNSFYKLLIVLTALLGVIIISATYFTFKTYKKRQIEKQLLLEKEQELNKAEIEKQKLATDLTRQKINQREADIKHLQELMNAKSSVTKEMLEKLSTLRDTISPEDRNKLSAFILSMKGYEGGKDEVLSHNLNSDELFSLEFNSSIKAKHPKLSETEVKLCSLIYLGFDSKRISQIRNISPESIRTFKYRIKKKIGLGKEKDLETYLKTEII